MKYFLLPKFHSKALLRIIPVLLILLCARPLVAAENAVLITLDGLRWQELFRGLDEDLATHEAYSEQSALIRRRFEGMNSADSAAAIFPFIYSSVFAGGSYVGDRDSNSCAAVSNPWYFSYPGYSEILTGVVNESIDSNAKIDNPERTIHELLNARADFRGRTAAFGSWDVFPFIFNVDRSEIFVNAFSPLQQPVGEFEQLLNQLHQDIPTPWPSVRNDAFTHHYAMSYLRRERPRLLFISYGETDDFAHDGKYDEYILAANRTDGFIRDVWETLQSIPGYRDNTVLFITVDHGRGEEPIETWLHHASKRSIEGYMSSLAQYEEGIVGSEATWMAAMGPGVATQGLVHTGELCITSDRIAATLLELLGEDYRDYNQEMGSPIEQFLQ